MVVSFFLSTTTPVDLPKNNLIKHKVLCVQFSLACFGLNDFYIIAVMFLCIGMRLRRIPIHSFGNRMVVVHPSLTKDSGSRSTNAFWNEKIVVFLHGYNPPYASKWLINRLDLL